MKFLLSGLVLACHCALSSWSVSSVTHAVTQSPDVSVTEGETVNISCCLITETSDVRKARVNWSKNHTPIKEAVITLGNHSVNSDSNNCSTLTLLNVTKKDSGRYVCRVTVEIPVYRVIDGNGTVITVRGTEITKDMIERDPGAPLNSFTVAAVAVAVPLFILTLVCFCILRRKRGSAEAARVIYEVPHIDSEVADFDKHSTSSSRGSSQWCQVPVYEAFDYFEHMPTKESG